MSTTRAVSLASVVMIATSALLFAGCRQDDEPDAYGNFEATETVVSAETGGTLLWFTPVEGQQVAPGKTLAVVDTARLALDREQLDGLVHITSAATLRRAPRLTAAAHHPRLPQGQDQL